MTLPSVGYSAAASACEKGQQWLQVGGGQLGMPQDIQQTLFFLGKVLQGFRRL